MLGTQPGTKPKSSPHTSMPALAACSAGSLDRALSRHRASWRLHKGMGCMGMRRMGMGRMGMGRMGMGCRGSRRLGADECTREAAAVSLQFGGD